MHTEKMGPMPNMDVNEVILVHIFILLFAQAQCNSGHAMTLNVLSNSIYPIPLELKLALMVIDINALEETLRGNIKKGILVISIDPRGDITIMITIMITTIMITIVIITITINTSIHILEMAQTESLVPKVLIEGVVVVQGPTLNPMLLTVILGLTRVIKIILFLF